MGAMSKIEGHSLTSRIICVREAPMKPLLPVIKSDIMNLLPSLLP